jgi:hypothetical protein
MIDDIKNSLQSRADERLQSPSDDSNIPTRRTCGTMDLHRKLLEQSEEYRRNRANIESKNHK